MFNNIHFLLRSALIAIVAASSAFTLAEFTTAQTVGNFSGINIDDGNDNGNYPFFPFSVDGANGLAIGSNLTPDVGSFILRQDAPDGGFSIGPRGIGIGLPAKSSDTLENAQAALHVVGGGTPLTSFTDSPAFPEAQVFIEDRNTDVADRGLLALTNNGTSRISISDRSDSFLSVFMTGGGGAFNFQSGLGVGINVPVPEARLHIRRLFGDQIGLMVESDDHVSETRNMIDVVNNGPMIQQFTDTSTAEPGVFQLESRSDRFSVLQLGNNRAGLLSLKMALFDLSLTRNRKLQ